MSPFFRSLDELEEYRRQIRLVECENCGCIFDPTDCVLYWDGDLPSIDCPNCGASLNVCMLHKPAKETRE